VIILLVAGIFVLFGVFGDEIVAMIGKIVDVFKEIGSIVLDVIDSLVNTVVDFVGTLIEKLFMGLFGSGSNTEKKEETTDDINRQPDKVDIIDGVTLDEFDKAINKIILPLNMLSFSVASIAEMEMLKSLNPMGMSMGALTTAVGTIYNVMENNPTIKNADNTDSNINYQEINEEESPLTLDDVKKFMTAINKLVATSENIYNKIPSKSVNNSLITIG